ncbi:MAG: TIGR03089 family protein [Candidatus Nanopelagicales bacterium]
MIGAATPYELLVGHPDRSRPMVTHYDGPDRRVELSVASVANAVAKAAGLLCDELGFAPGERVSVDLPRHWQLPVWVLAALSVGARCGRDLAGPVEVRVVGPDRLAELRAGAEPGAREVLACSCDSFGMPVPGGVPAGILDVGVEARAQPDVFFAQPQAAAAACLHVGGDVVAWPDLLAARPGAAGGPGPRLWVDETTAAPRLLHAVAIAPLLTGGSVVIGTHLSPAQAERIRAVERIDEQGS